MALPDVHHHNDGMTTCDECDGAGQRCRECHEVPDNCECPGEPFVDCEACNGDGMVEAEDEEEEEEDR